MKHRNLLKWGCPLVLVLIIASLIYVACDAEKPVSSETGDAISSLNKTPYSFATIKPELKKLLAHLQLNPEIINPSVLAKAAEGYATINDLGLESRFPVEFPLENGNTFEVYIELFNGSVGNGETLEDADAYLVLDIDRYPEDVEGTDPDGAHEFFAQVAATAHNRGNGLFVDPGSRQKLRLESNTQKVKFMLIFVGGEERLSKAHQEELHQKWLTSRPGLAKAQADPTTVYWWITKIKLDNKKDSSGEEFELYLGPDGSDGVGHPFSSYAFLLFNGTYQNDASGISRRCPDINNVDTYYPPHPIAVEVLTPDSPLGFKSCPIEDDCTTSWHKNGGSVTYYYTMNVEDIDGMSWYNRTYAFSIVGDCGDDDDIYNNSGTVSFGACTWDCVYSYPNAPYVRMCLRKGTVGDADSNWNGGACESSYACPAWN